MSMGPWKIRCRHTLPLAALALGLWLSAGVARADGEGVNTVGALYATLLDVMKNGQALGPPGRYAQIAPVIPRVFDIPFMTRLAIGPGWEALDEMQRQQVTQAFERYIAAVYADRFDSYSGEKLRVIGEQASNGGPVILSEIVKSNGDPVRINYLMRQSGGTWQIADVYLNGTISELATRRSEFASILRYQGINGLIATLNNKAVSLGAAHAS
jgi:phospholipid transport system substrate-binding protein